MAGAYCRQHVLLRVCPVCVRDLPADADIEAILQKGERDTADLNDKMNKFTDNAKQFTMDGGISLYDYKDEVGGE